MLTRRAILGGLAACVPALRVARAQPFARPIVLMHGFAPGGPADSIARLLAGPLGSALGRPIAVEARPGAGGNIAAAAVSRATPDGSVIGLVNGGHAVMAAFGRNENYDPVDGFEPIVQVVRYAFVLAVRNDNPVHDLQALLRAAGASSDAWQFGSAGIGTTQHLTGELLNAMGKVHMTHVPYRGDSASIAALLSGEVPLAITASNVAQPFYESGHVRLLAVTGPTRSARLPDVPTVAEAALPGFDASTWAGLLAPRGTPPETVARLNEAANQALRDPTLQARLVELVDGEAVGGTPAAMRHLMITEIARWRQLIEDRHITAE
jgi:tripartite-type tricarboxylate transporter receptor subunit TctC